MSTYTVNDFRQSLSRVHLAPRTWGQDKTPPANPPVRVIAAWGYTSDEGWSDWYGGFLMTMSDGTIKYLYGWCDTSGWGCQDDATLIDIPTDRIVLPELAAIDHPPHIDPATIEWDMFPVDLNKYLMEVNTRTNSD
jgi:hypothetical protein